MDISVELSQSMKYQLFVNHTCHDDYLSATVSSVVGKYFDNEVDPFMESFRETLSDTRLGAHAMLPTTPAATRLRRRPGPEAALPPLLPGKQVRKRKAPTGHDSRKKRVSYFDETRDETEDKTDTTACYNDSDVTTILSDSTFQDPEVSQLTRQPSRRGKRKRTPIPKQVSSVSRATRNSSKKDDSILDTKPNIQSHSTPDLSPSSSCALLSQAPDRPALPSFIESSAPSTPPERPPTPSLLKPPALPVTPPTLSLPLPSLPTTPREAMERQDSTELYLSPLAAPSTQPIEASPMQRDSLDKSNSPSRPSLSPAPANAVCLPPLAESHIPQTLPSNPLTPQLESIHEPQLDRLSGSPPPSIEVADSSLTEIHTPSFTQQAPLPTPSKTFSILKHADSDLCISPPSDPIPRIPSTKTPRPLIQSPLLEQHSGPSRFASKYDHISEEKTSTRTPQKPANLPTGITHSIHKPTRFPHNSPSRFHQKCSPSSPHAPPQTPISRPIHTRLNLSTKCKPSLAKTLKPVISIPHLFSPLPSAAAAPVGNSSLQQIPRGLVSCLTDRFQAVPGELQCAKLATTVSTFFNKKPAPPAAKNPEDTKVKIQQKQIEDEKRAIGLNSFKQNVLDKKKQENMNRQKIAAQRRAELERQHKEKFDKKLESKEEKRKIWDKQSIRKKKAEEERRKREEMERKKADISQLKATHSIHLAPSSASTTFNTSSFLSTIPYNDVTSYQIDDLDSENTDDEESPRHQIPSWATEPYLSHSLRIQFTTKIDTDLIFPPHHLLRPMELTLLFEYNRYRRTRRPYNYRTSSALWTSPMFKTS